jgi:hypothetical protein
MSCLETLQPELRVLVTRYEPDFIEPAIIPSLELLAHIKVMESEKYELPMPSGVQVYGCYKDYYNAKVPREFGCYNLTYQAKLVIVRKSETDITWQSLYRCCTKIEFQLYKKYF